MKVNDLVVVVDERNTTNGEHVGLEGRIIRISDDEYPYVIEFKDGYIEIFDREELELAFDTERIEKIKAENEHSYEWARGTHYAEVNEEAMEDYIWLTELVEQMYDKWGVE